MTRNSELEGDTKVFPDMRVKVEFEDGSTSTILSEHKWNSHCNDNQLSRYLNVARGQPVVFIGANRRQIAEAQRTLRRNCFLWEEVYCALDGVAEKTDILQQFLVFMKTHQLTPGKPITLTQMQAYLQSGGFVQSLERAAEKLSSEREWDFIPARFHLEKQVRNRFGRVAIEFATHGWRPTVTVGFLIDPRDHRVSFTNSNKGIDLMLRIEAMPLVLQGAEPALTLLKRKRPELMKTASSVLLLKDPGNGNGHSLILVRTSLWDVIANAANESEQLEIVFAHLKRWLQVLFEDGELERVFRKTGLDSGM